MKHFGMELETKSSVTGVQKLVALFGILFCSVVAVLLVLLYYPSDRVEKEFEDDFVKMASAGSSKGWLLTNAGHQDAPKSRVEEVARAMEDFGAAFLALLAVCCIAIGLTCLFCACCILK